MKLKQIKSKFSIVLYIAASIIAILGTALLINNVLLYYNNITQYVAQGYSVDTVAAQLIPSQLIPGILEPISIYWGIALLLVGAGIINQKVSKCLEALTESKDFDIVAEESTLKEETVKDTETANDTVTAEGIESIEDNETIEECSVAVEGNK